MRINCKSDKARLRGGIFGAALVACCVAVAGCIHARTMIVIDSSNTSTTLRHCALEDSPYFKVVLGDAVHEIPLSDVRMVKIDPASSIVFEREMYYAAQVVLKDGSVLGRSGGAGTLQNGCYIGLRNTLKGKRYNEIYRIPLQNVVQIKYDR